MITAIEIFILSVIAGLYYREGGSQYGMRWYRPFGVGICACLVLTLLGFWHWTLLLTGGVFSGLSTSYFKKKGTDAKWWNWLLVGLVFGISPLPSILAFHYYIGFAIRAAICTALMVYWMQIGSFKVHFCFRKTFDKAVIDEFGRGFIAIITLPLLLIGG